MAKGIKITCNNCGNSVAFIYSSVKVAEIASEWRCCNSALVCPECCKTWDAQANGPLGNAKTTTDIIDSLANE